MRVAIKESMESWYFARKSFGMAKDSKRFSGFIIHRFLMVLMFFAVFQIHAQSNDSINFVSESNKIFKPNIKTVLFHRDGWELSPPMIKLNTDEKLRLSFDDLDGDKKDFSFTIVHCDRDWKPSGLRTNEYIDGYEEDKIIDFQFSLNTIVSYTHYELTFPTEAMKPKLSGNYILKVFEDDSDSLYFTRRFYIDEQKVSIDGKVKQATGIEDRNYKHEIDFSITAKGYKISNPYNDLKVIVMQNGRIDNMITDLQPKMVVNDKYDYDYDLENVFYAGNEFRSFDIKSLKYYTENISSIRGELSGYDVYLKDSQKRSFQVYKTDKDINGQMKIKTEDGAITETQAEYVTVHFFLPMPAPMIDGDIFIIGQLTDWQFSDESKLSYNFKRKGYEKSLLLKQGYYNYHYIMRYHDMEEGDVSFIEGTHYETENRYTIFVYHFDISKGYDRLVGVKFLSSLPENK